MTELKFNGAATIVGFPRDKAFGFEIEGDVLILKAGKEVFLRVEKEAAPAVATPTPENIANIGYLPPQTAIALPYSTPENLSPLASSPAPSTETGETATSSSGGEKTRKPRSPSIPVDENAIIQMDVNRPNPYSKLRGKYFETLKTAVGRPVSWWKETTMVKSLEGSPLTLLRFFLSEGVITLRNPLEVVGQSMQNPVQPILPQNGFNQGQPMQQQVAGAMWTPQGGPAPGQSGGATFLP